MKTHNLIYIATGKVIYEGSYEQCEKKRMKMGIEGSFSYATLKKEDK